MKEEGGKGREVATKGIETRSESWEESWERAGFRLSSTLEVGREL